MTEERRIDVEPFFRALPPGGEVRGFLAFDHKNFARLRAAVWLVAIGDIEGLTDAEALQAFRDIAAAALGPEYRRMLEGAL